MMSIKVDWEKLRMVQYHLTENVSDEDEILFTLLIRDGSTKRHVVKFKDFLNFFWSISENTNYNVYTVLVQDTEGRVLYRHKQLTNGNEEIPIGGNESVILHWGALTSKEKDMFVRLTVAQINGYEK